MNFKGIEFGCWSNYFWKIWSLRSNLGYKNSDTYEIFKFSFINTDGMDDGDGFKLCEVILFNMVIWKG